MPQPSSGFDVLHRYLGVGVGETLGYLATAAWTLLVLASGILDGVMPRWARWVGGAAALGILAGVAEPTGLAVAGTINFAGYLLWSLWLIGFGVGLIRSTAAGA